ncbi:MAG: histidine phosphatase family protein [Rhodospirillaceae bacterium]|nr:histidine phosphatase family protein [Rhodospirillaceae bacterium]
MKTLYLLRHEKSSWEDPHWDDFDRPLAPRGIKACKQMKAYLKQNKIKPDLIICSPAERARETYMRIAGAFSRKTEIKFEHTLYDANSQTLLKRLRRVDRKVSSIMMIGHNTALEHFALALTSGTETKSLARMRKKYPTLALASIKFQRGTWASASPGCARLSDFVVPRDLKGGKVKK